MNESFLHTTFATSSDAHSLTLTTMITKISSNFGILVIIAFNFHLKITQKNIYYLETQCMNFVHSEGVPSTQPALSSIRDPSGGCLTAGIGLTMHGLGLN